MKLTDDVRVAGASVLLLAVTPVHAYRTALGFGDHHAFDYIWLGLTVFLVVWWEKELREGRATNQFDSRLLWLVTVGLAVLLTVQSLSWVGSAIHLLPFGALVVVRGAIALYESKSPARATLPYLGGLGLAGLLVLVVHLWLAWFPLSRAVIPLVVVVSATGVIAFLETGRYLSISPRRTLASGLGLTAVTATLVVLTSSLLEPVIQRAIGLFRTRSIAESTGLFSSDVGVVILPILLFGLMLFLAIPFIALGGWRTMKHRDALWAVPVVYAVYFLLWAMVKIRFAGPLSLFTSLFAGWGLVRAAVWVDAARPLSLFDSTESIPRFERPDTQQFFSVLFLFLLVAGLGIVQTPIKQGQLAVDDSTYETSQWLAAYSEDEGMEYPENGVFARWDNTRVYNYFVNGQSNSYGFERRNYDSFLGSTEPGDWYERLRDRYGFVVFTQPRNGTAGPTVENRMRTDENGESTLPTFEHFRLVHTADNGPQQVFELVEVATVVGVQEPNGTASVRTDVPVSGTSRTYERTASPNPYGLYAVTVPYPGDYSADGEQVSISPAAVQDGSRFIQHTREGLLHWPFDEINGSVVYDRVGGFQGHGSNLTVTTDSRRGQAIEFDRSNHSQLATDIQAPSEFTVSTWIKPTALDTTAENDYRNIVRSSAGLFLVLEENGRVSLRLPGTDAKPRAGGNVTLDEWHHVAATYDGTEYVLYLDGSRVGSGTAEGATVSWGGQLRVGTGSIQRHTFDGIIDDFRIYDRALSPEALGEQAAAES